MRGARKGSWLALLVFGSAAFAAPEKGKASPYVVQEASAEVAIVDGNEAAATKQATESAVREAVQQAAGVILESDTITANSQLVKDQITTHSQGYVHHYDVLSKSSEGGVEKVTVRVEVGRADLDRDLLAIKGLIQRLNNKKLAIYFDETALRPDQTVIKTSTMSTVLTEAFAKDGWTLLDPAFLNGKVQLNSGIEAVGTQLHELVNPKQADYIVYGVVRFTYAPNDPMMAQLLNSGYAGSGGQVVHLVTGSYDVGIYATDTGSVITKLTETFDSWMPGTDRSEGKIIPEAKEGYEQASIGIIKRRKDEILGKVRGAIVDYLRKAELDGRRIVLTIRGIPYSAGKTFLSQLAARDPAVRGNDAPNFDEGTMTVDLRFVGTSDELADRLTAVPVSGHTLEITKVSANTVEAKLTK